MPEKFYQLIVIAWMAFTLLLLIAAKTLLLKFGCLALMISFVPLYYGYHYTSVVINVIPLTIFLSHIASGE